MDKDYFSIRRTIRKFKDEPVSGELMDSILEKAMRAPTCGNMQLYSVIETRDPEKKALLLPTHFNQPAAVGAPVLLTVCADFNRFTRWCRLNGADAAFDNFLSFMNAVEDAVIFAQQILSVAESEGLGVCWLGTTLFSARATSELLNLPELTVPVAGLAIGWPDEAPQQCERLALDTIRHRETYRQDSDEDIRRQFKVKEEFPMNSGFAAENGKENLAQVFAEVRYPRSLNEPLSEVFLKLLHDKRFL